jgi:hypothetical protein
MVNRPEPSKFGPIGQVIINIIPHKNQRYDTAGDWYRKRFTSIFRDESVLFIHTSRLPNDPDNFYALAVAYHELSEALACIANGITETDVDQFDVDFKGKGEPGDDPRSPYRKQHFAATICEMTLIAAMNKSWSAYNKAIDALPKWRKPKK